MTNIRCYHVKHKLNLTDLLSKAQRVADYAVENKRNRKVLTTKYVKEIGLPSTISCQILRKYSGKTIKAARNVNLIIPNSSHQTVTLKSGITKTYSNIIWKAGRVELIPLKLSFRWNPGRPFLKINQVEIDNQKFMISATFEDQIVDQEYRNVLGIDLNCGMGRSIVNAANLVTGELLNLGKKGPNIRKFYFKKRQAHKTLSNKEKRTMKDLDHKISNQIVNYAAKHCLQIVVEDLTGIRMGVRKGKGSKHVNRFVNSWSFYRLQSFIEYKAKERGIPFQKVPPHYTSQECSYCGVIGNRKGDTFICENKRCQVWRKERHADINAAFNIGHKALV